MDSQNDTRDDTHCVRVLNQYDAAYLQKILKNNRKIWLTQTKFSQMFKKFL